MIRKNLFLLLSLLVLHNCYSLNKEFQMKGTISPDFDGQCVYLQILVSDTSRITLVDTIKNGSFHFQGQPYPDKLSNLFFETKAPRSFRFLLVPILESGNIYVNINDSSVWKSTIKALILMMQ